MDDSVKTDFFSSIDPAHLPQHVALIMDGNGRWAKKRNMIRTNGHTEGLKRAKEIAAAASDIGIRYITFYVFSTENWKRTEQEVGFLMNLINTYLVAREATQEHAGLVQAHLGQRTRVEREGDDTSMARLQLCRRHIGLQIVRQMHHLRTKRLVSGVTNMYFLLGLLATVYIVKLDIVSVCQNLSQHEGIRSSIVDDLGHHHTFHAQSQRFVGIIKV